MKLAVNVYVYTYVGLLYGRELVVVNSANFAGEASGNWEVSLLTRALDNDIDSEFISSCSIKMLYWTQVDKNTVKKLKCKLSGVQQSHWHS